MFTSGINEDCGVPSDYWSFFWQMHAAQEADKHTLKTCNTGRCNSCGKFLSLFNAHLTVSQLGTIHIKEKCIERAVEKLRIQTVDWNWGLQK